MGVKNFIAAEIGAKQHGRITTRQLLDSGFTPKSIERAVEAGHLHRLHQGVYGIGHLAPSRESQWMAAVLACGPPAWLSDGCAAVAFGFQDSWGPLVEVTIPPDKVRRRQGVRVRRRSLMSWEVTEWWNVPITTPSRTMVDLAHELRDEDRITWALRQLEFTRLYDQKLLELSNQRRPSAVLTRLLRGVEPTLSPLEIAFLTRVVRRHNLPAPEVNARPFGLLVDFWWPDARLIVETDGKHHDLPLQRMADQARDALHEAAGVLTLRYRWVDAHVHDQRTADTIRATLTARMKD
jgi:very-short-patch-repair endonuclease